MKQSEARVRIIQEWDRWIVTQAIEQDGPTGKNSLKFFHELQDSRIAAIGFPVSRTGQVADHPRVAAGRRPIVRRLDIYRAPDRPGTPAAAGSQETGQDLNCKT